MLAISRSILLREMYNITNAYSLEFDISDTLREVLINNEKVIDYCEDLVEAIIDMSFELS